MKAKTKVALLYGGRSAEHEVSIDSARSVAANLDRGRFEPIYIYLDRLGRWLPVPPDEAGLPPTAPAGPGFSFLPWSGAQADQLEADIYFPVLHGPYGEDGRLQAVLEMAGRPFVGASSLASALAMDKGLSKNLFSLSGLPVVDFITLQAPYRDDLAERVAAAMPLPLFVKPSSLGSSIGISLVKDPAELPGALADAFSHGPKIIVEKALQVREIEVAVLGNDELLVSPAAEVFPANEFYDYEDKYIKGETGFALPASLSAESEAEIKQTAARAYRSLGINGMARVDLFIEKSSGRLLVNEINTIPGFTSISLFPRLMGLAGLSFSELLTRLIELGFEYWRKTEGDDFKGGRF